MKSVFISFSARWTRSSATAKSISASLEGGITILVGNEPAVFWGQAITSAVAICDVLKKPKKIRTSVTFSPVPISVNLRGLVRGIESLGLEVWEGWFDFWWFHST